MAPRSGGHFAAHAIGGPAWSTRRSARPRASAAGTQSIRSGSAETMRARTSRLAAAMPGSGRLTAGMIPPHRRGRQSKTSPSGRRSVTAARRWPTRRAWCSLRGEPAARRDVQPRRRGFPRRPRPDPGGAPRHALPAREAPPLGRVPPGATGRRPCRSPSRIWAAGPSRAATAASCRSAARRWTRRSARRARSSPTRRSTPPGAATPTRATSPPSSGPASRPPTPRLSG